MEKAKKALQKIQKSIPKAPAEIIHLDLASLVSIRKFANEFKDKFNRLDILINNAGIMAVPYKLTKDGFESQIGTNHLGHFALTALLKDLLISTKGSRVINVSSVGHKMGEMDFENFLFEKGNYSRFTAYGRSKLANILFAYELDRRFKAANIDASALASHPGMSNTNLANHMYGFLAPVMKPLMSLAVQSAFKGALPTIRAAVDSKAKGGEYYGPKGIFGESRGKPSLVESSKRSHDVEDAKKLWELSENLTGIKFEI